MLKRGLSMLIEEWLLAAEYVLSQERANSRCDPLRAGDPACEKETRNTLDLAAVPVAQRCRICRSSSTPVTRPASVHMWRARSGRRRRRG